MVAIWHSKPLILRAPARLKSLEKGPIFVSLTVLTTQFEKETQSGRILVPGTCFGK